MTKLGQCWRRLCHSEHQTEYVAKKKRRKMLEGKIEITNKS